MNLICFPHYTCGGLLGDILSNTFSPMLPNGGIESFSHTLGKIGDSASVHIDYNVAEFMAKVSKVERGTWVGTHCWPGRLPLTEFDKIINVTTATSRSKIYRWLRAYNLYFAPQWTELQGLELTDKVRETAKSYLIGFVPVQAANVYNIEFADVVENTAEFKHLVDYRNTDMHLGRWQETNKFLFDSNLWNSDAVKSFYQAEHETALKRYYRYE